jgi:hypothetical protein
MEESLRHRIPVCRTAIHSSDVSSVAGFSRHTRRLQRKKGIDYFENSRRATYVHSNMESRIRWGSLTISEYGWGLTASDGPGPAVLEVNGFKESFTTTLQEGAPFGPDDGTISPWAVVASLPFAPEIVIDTVRHAIERLRLKGAARMDSMPVLIQPILRPAKSARLGISVDLRLESGSDYSDD